MAAETTCPVCQFAHIPLDSDTCPQCDSDLICFRLLDALPDSLNEAQPELINQPDEAATQLTNQLDEAVPNLTNHVESDQNIEPGKQIFKQSESPAAANIPQKTISQWSGFVFGMPGIVFGMLVLSIIVYLLGYTSYRLSSMESTVEKIYRDNAQLADNQQKETASSIEALKNVSVQMNRFDEHIQELAGLTKKQAACLTKMAETKEKEVLIKNSKGEKEKDPEEQKSVLPVSEVKIKIPDLKNNIEKETPCFRIYHATDDDTLWEIARALYGAGHYYPVLLEHNPDLHVYRISSKDTIRYLCKPALAAGVYRSITALKHNRRYWKYTVRPARYPEGCHLPILFKPKRLPYRQKTL